MLEQNNNRKYSIQQNYEIEENHTYSVMFPRTDAFSQEETLDLLKLKYDSKLHSSSLINCCFRSHKTPMVDFFSKFKQLNHPELEQPRISQFYSNDCFMNLYDLGKYLDGKLNKYPTYLMGAVPQNLKKMLDNIFAEQGYIPSFQRFLLFYPNYLQKHNHLEGELFEDNQIDNKIAYFLGIVACAELGSIYGINRMLGKFCKVGGDIEWVTKNKYPEKIRRILKLNRKLARCIWEINSDDIEQILQAKIWTKNELAFIIQILTFAHNYATISLAIGLNCQETSDSIINFSALISIKNKYNSLYYESNEGLKLASVIENISRNSSNSDEDNQKTQKKKQILDKLQQQNSGSRKTLKKSLRKSDNEDMIENYMKQIGNQLTKQEVYYKLQHVLKPLLQDYHGIQKRTDKEYPPLDASDTNFKYTAFPLLYNLSSKTAELNLNLITYSEIMTSNNFGHSIIDGTKSFRKAIRYYCENLCGSFHFQYNYKNISNYLTMPLKFYIRLLTLSPVHINNQILNEIKHEQGQLNLFDLGHVAILASNCKMGLSLTFSMHSFEC